MTEQPRDWDKELADIDRVIAQQGSGVAGPGGAPASPRAPATPGTAPGPIPAGRPRRGGAAVTWLWVLLAVALAAALGLWPYQHVCGLQAVFYVGAAGVTALVGGVAALSSWTNHRGLAHVVSLLVIAWAAVVAAGEVLPRVGYAREVRTWTCETAPAAPAPSSAPGTRAPAGIAPVDPSTGTAPADPSTGTAPAGQAPVGPPPGTAQPARP